MNISIHFSRNPPIYFPGENVDGKVVIHVSFYKNVTANLADLEVTASTPTQSKCDTIQQTRQVVIKVFGEAKNHWSVTTSSSNSDGTTSSSTCDYHSSIDIIRGESRVWGECVGRSELPAGETKIPFSFHLSPYCLSNFKNYYGHICYHLSVEVDTGRWNFNKKAIQEFTVPKLTDLRLNPSLFVKNFTENTENIGIPLFRKGKVTLKTSIPRIGCVPNELLDVTLTIENKSKRVVDELEISFEEYAEFVAFEFGEKKFSVHDPFQLDRAKWMDNKRCSRKSVGKKQMPINVQPNSSQNLIVPFEIPTVLSSFECAIIRLHYMLIITISSHKTMNSKICCQLPIVIGNIPISTAPLPEKPGISF